MIEQQLEALLMASVTCGVHPLILPESPAFPAITYSIIASTPSPTFDGHGTQRVRAEVNCYGNTYPEASTLRHTLVQALDGYAANGLTISSISSHDFFDSTARKFRAMVEFYLYAPL